MSCVACNTEKALNMMFIGQASQKYLKMTAVQSLLLRCYLHLWYTCSSSFASLLPPDLLPPQYVSAPGIAGGATAPCPTGGTKARAWQKPAVWSVRHLRLPHPPGSQWSSTSPLPGGSGQPARMAGLCDYSRRAQQRACAEHSGRCIQQFSTIVSVCLCVENWGVGLTPHDFQKCHCLKKLYDSNHCTEKRVGQGGTGGYFCVVSLDILLFSWMFLQKKLKFST